MSESKNTAAPNIVAVLKAGDTTKKIAFTEISMSGCTTRLSFGVNREQPVTLQLFEDRGNGKYDPFAPIAALVESVTPRKTPNKIVYEATIRFKGTATAKHGIARILDQSREKNASHTDAKPENQNKATFIISVTCPMCGHEHIPFRALQRRTMAGHSNIFGVQQFTEALPGKDYCNYNLIRVTVCPTCFFASGYADDFIKESRAVKNASNPFDVEPVIAQWDADVPKRKKLVESNLDGFFNETRTLQQALLSYDLAVLTSDVLLQAEQEKKERARNYEIALKGVFYMMIKAELLMSNKKATEAEQTIKAALKKLEQIFPYLKRVSSIKAAFLMGMLGLYFESTKIVSDSYNFLQQYDKNNRVRFGTEEHKTLMTSLKKFKEAYQYRNDFSRKNLKGFNKPFDL